MSELLAFKAGKDDDGGDAKLSGTLLSITFRNEDNGYTVARIEVEGRSGPVTAVGVMPGVETGDTLALAGRWSEHPSYGRQLDVTRCE
ncbi:MAG: YrrC family ATP-dependent DNA helicase, partial [Planctomycetota bacterium]